MLLTVFIIIKAGTATDELTMGMDLLPTIMERAKIDISNKRAVDGASIHDLLFEQKHLSPRKVFFGYEPKLGKAMRDGNWKMIIKAGQVELYDLSNDISERNNLVEEHPDRAKKMKSAIAAWKEDVVRKP